MKVVYIEGMEMPVSCRGCNMFDQEYWVCTALDRDIEELPMGRVEWCPLREVEVE